MVCIEYSPWLGAENLLAWVEILSLSSFYDESVFVVPISCRSAEIKKIIGGKKSYDSTKFRDLDGFGVDLVSQNDYSP